MTAMNVRLARPSNLWSTAAIVGAVVLLVGIAMTASTLLRTEIAPHEAPTLAAEIVHYDTIEEMVATSTAVVEGEVTDVRVLSELRLAEQVITTYGITVAVSQSYRGQPPPQLLMVENGALATPSKVGDRGFYFLIPRGDIPGLRLASSQGRYRIGPSGRLFGSNPDDALVQELQSQSVEELRKTIATAVDTVDRNNISPKPMPVGGG